MEGGRPETFVHILHGGGQFATVMVRIYSLAGWKELIMKEASAASDFMYCYSQERHGLENTLLLLRYGA